MQESQNEDDDFLNNILLAEEGQSIEPIKIVTINELPVEAEETKEVDEIKSIFIKDKNIPKEWTEASKAAADYFGLDLVDEHTGNGNVPLTYIKFPEITITANNRTGSELIEDLYVWFDIKRCALYGARMKFPDRHITNFMFDHSHLSGSGVFCLGSSSFKEFWISLMDTIDSGEEIDDFSWTIFFGEMISYLQTENHINGSPYKQIKSIEVRRNSTTSFSWTIIDGWKRDNVFKDNIIFDGYNFKKIEVDNSYEFWNQLALRYVQYHDYKVSAIKDFVGLYDIQTNYGNRFFEDEENNQVITYQANRLPTKTITFKGKKVSPKWYPYQKKKEDLKLEKIVNPEYFDRLYFTKDIKYQIIEEVKSYYKNKFKDLVSWN